MYYKLITKVPDNAKQLTGSIPSNDPCLKNNQGIKINVTHTNYDQNDNKNSEQTFHFIEPEWVSNLDFFKDPEQTLPSPLPVYIDDEEGGKRLLAGYDSPFFIICTELITALNAEGIKGDFITHPVEIRDPSANKVHSNYVTFKPSRRFVHAINEDESEVSDIIDGKTFYDRITIDPNKVDEHDLFLHTIREGSSYSLVISEKIKTIFEMFAPDDFIFSPLFIEEDNDDEDENDDWGSWN